MVNVRDIVFSTSGGFGQSSAQPEVSSNDFLGVAASGASSILKAKEERDAAAFNAKAGTDLQLFGAQALEDARTSVDDPNKITETFFQNYEAKYQELKASAPNGFAVQQLDQNYQQLKSSIGTRAISTQVGEVQAVRLGQLGNTIDDLSTAVRNGYSLGEASARLSDVLVDAEGFTSPSEIMKLRDDANRNLKLSELSRMEERGQYGGISKLINDTKFNKDLNAGDIDSFRGRVQSYRKRVADQQEVVSAIEGQGFIDPKDRKSKKKIDLLYRQQIQPGLAGGDEASYTNAVNLISTFGVIPDTLAGEVRAAYVGQAGVDKSRVYQMVSDINAANPRILEGSGLTKNQINEALLYTDLKDKGVSEREARNYVDNAIAPRDESIIKARKEELADNIIGDIDLSKVSSTFLDPDLPNIGGLSRAVEIEWQELAEKVYLETGDAEFAKKRAYEIKGSEYAVSKVTQSDSITSTGRLMRDAPEIYYGNHLFVDENGDHTHKWMQKQLNEMVKGELGKDVPIDDVTLLSDHITKTEIKKGIPPSYPVYVQTEEDGLQYLGRTDFNLDDEVRKKVSNNRRSAKRHSIGAKLAEELKANIPDVSEFD